MIKDIKEINFPDYATLSSATVTLNDMGDKTISTQVKIDGAVIPDFSYDWVVEFKGERYIQPLRQPQAGKNTDSKSSTINLTFYQWAIWQMKRYYFVEMASTESGTPIADKYIASLGLNLSDFCVAFQKVLDYYFDGEITIDLNPEYKDEKGVQFMGISYSYIWDVLQKVYEVYGVRWTIEGNTIKVGYPSAVLSHIFQYGYEGGLMSIERQVQDSNIRNSLLGRGGEQNLPAYYFKEAPQDSLFVSDPDAIPELANIYFANLRGKTFRDYVKGWKAKHYDGEPMVEPTEEYTKGYTDTTFNPIEYVKDDASIEKYGLLQGALENNDDIYPSIQNAPNSQDVVIAVEKVLSDNIDESILYDSVIENISPYHITLDIEGNDSIQQEAFIANITIPEHYAGKVSSKPIIVSQGNVELLLSSIVMVNKTTGETIVDASIYQDGEYDMYCRYAIHNMGSTATQVTFALEQIKVHISVFDYPADLWKPTFDIWVKNIWDSKRNEGESDEAYAERVWRPILGDRQGNDAKVCFSTGWLSSYSDYEFTIVDFAYDGSKSYNGVSSEWRLTLQKSDAELEATGKYIPSSATNGQAQAGDKFFFIGIDMPYDYVLWAEERLDDYKYTALNEVCEIQPQWVVRFDKLRIQDEDNLIDALTAGGVINIADVRFISAQSIALYLTSVTYSWEDGGMTPNVEVVLADKVTPIQSTVSQIQGSIEIINSQLSGIGNAPQLVRQIGDALYLRKDGTPDTSKSPTKFVGNISGYNFEQGLIGGTDWGIYKDVNGLSVAEFDKIIARNDLTVNTLVVNQVSAIGGIQVMSAAAMTVSRVVETEDGYECFFDQKNGSIANLFKVNDIAYSQRYDADNVKTKYYKRIVTDVSVDSITLSKTEKDGDGIPTVDDNIIHFGNTTDVTRQSIVIIDPLNGGSIQVYSNVNSFNLDRKNYVGIGFNLNTQRAFIYGYGDVLIGDRDMQNNYISYRIPEGKEEAELHINADVVFGDKSTTSWGETIISNGKLNTSLIDTDTLVAKKIESREGTIADFTIQEKQLVGDGNKVIFSNEVLPTLEGLLSKGDTTYPIGNSNVSSGSETASMGDGRVELSLNAYVPTMEIPYAGMMTFRVRNTRSITWNDEGGRLSTDASNTNVRVQRIDADGSLTDTAVYAIEPNTIRTISTYIPQAGSYRVICESNHECQSMWIEDGNEQPYPTYTLDAGVEILGVATDGMVHLTGGQECTQIGTDGFYSFWSVINYLYFSQDEGLKFKGDFTATSANGEYKLAITDNGIIITGDVSADYSSGKVLFDIAKDRTNVESGETFGELFGKVQRYFTDLKSVAFTGSYKDLTDKPEIPTLPEIPDVSSFITTEEVQQMLIEYAYRKDESDKKYPQYEDKGNALTVSELINDLVSDVIVDLTKLI